jgi:hypothetical protein
MTHWLLPLLLLSSSAVAQTVVPDPTLTPGAVRTTDVSDVCTHGTSQLRHWSRERDAKIMVEYGLPLDSRSSYEIDHLIPLGIGGADDDANLWPEPTRRLEPEWNAERKDELEWKVRDMVCSGRIDIDIAQQAFATDWTAAWTLYVGR